MSTSTVEHNFARFQEKEDISLTAGTMIALPMLVLSTFALENLTLVPCIASTCGTRKVPTMFQSICLPALRKLLTGAGIQGQHAVQLRSSAWALQSQPPDLSALITLQEQSA